MPTFGNVVTTITQDTIVPKVVDIILNGNVLTMRMLPQARTISGETYKIPVKYQKSTAGGWYQLWDPFATNQTSVRVKAEYRMRQQYQTASIAGAQAAGNAGDAKVLDLIRTEMESVAEDMVDTWGTGLYSDGTGSGNLQLIGLDAAVDDGAGTGTYAGLLRTTYNPSLCVV